MDRQIELPKILDAKVEDVSSDHQAETAADEEHKQSVWTILRKDPKVVFWCLFFAFSAVGW